MIPCGATGGGGEAPDNPEALQNSLIGHSVRADQQEVESTRTAGPTIPFTASPQRGSGTPITATPAIAGCEQRKEAQAERRWLF